MTVCGELQAIDLNVFVCWKPIVTTHFNSAIYLRLCILVDIKAKHPSSLILCFIYFLSFSPPSSQTFLNSTFYCFRVSYLSLKVSFFPGRFFSFFRRCLAASFLFIFLYACPSVYLSVCLSVILSSISNSLSFSFFLPFPAN